MIEPKRIATSVQNATADFIRYRLPVAEMVVPAVLIGPPTTPVIQFSPFFLKEFASARDRNLAREARFEAGVR